MYTKLSASRYYVDQTAVVICDSVKDDSWHITKEYDEGLSKALYRVVRYRRWSRTRDIAGRLRGGREKSLTENDIDYAINMKSRGMSTKEIAEHFGVSRPTISKYQNKPLTATLTRSSMLHRSLYGIRLQFGFSNQDIENVNILQKRWQYADWIW